MGQANTAPCLSISSQIQQGTWEADKAKIVIFNFKLYIQHAIMLFVFKKKWNKLFLVTCSPPSTLLPHFSFITKLKSCHLQWDNISYLISLFKTDSSSSYLEQKSTSNDGYRPWGHSVITVLYAPPSMASWQVLKL